MARAFRPIQKEQQTPPTAFVARAAQIASNGRKLAMYDVVTGLLAPWFMDLRCTEECYRAVRYRRPLTLVLLQVIAEADSANTVKEVVDLLLRDSRRSDLAAYLGDGRIAILMPETDLRAAHGAIARLCRFIEGIDAAVSSYPNDGGNFEQLKAAAASRLLGIKRAA